MEFDIGNILYVVITLVAIIASLLGKKKKPAGQNKKPGFFENLEQVLKMGQEDPVLSDLQDYEPDLGEEDAEYEYLHEDEPLIAEQAVMEEAPSSIFADYEGLMASVQAPLDGKAASDQMELIDLDDGDEPDYFDIVKDFDARTAVIYSAIINRVNY